MLKKLQTSGVWFSAKNSKVNKGIVWLKKLAEMAAASGIESLG